MAISANSAENIASIAVAANNPEAKATISGKSGRAAYLPDQKWLVFSLIREFLWL